jgi:hypothetical protein
MAIGNTLRMWREGRSWKVEGGTLKTKDERRKPKDWSDELLRRTEYVHSNYIVSPFHLQLEGKRRSLIGVLGDALNFHVDD